MRGHDPAVSVAGNYQQFAAEAHGRSAPYEALARAVAGDPDLLAFLAELPAAKRQPNLLFAAAYFLLGQPPAPASLRGLVTGRRAELASVMLARRTQTNEPARCASLLPALATLPGPLALIEIGASAGLTLLADRYSYDYAGHRIAGTDPLAPVLSCTPVGPVPLPDRVPAVSWRAGLDLNPLDVTSDDDMHWLSCLLWPGETGRAERLAAAIATARRDPPPVRPGDLRSDLGALAAQAPPEATLVIFHTAVLAYIDPAERAQVAEVIAGLGAVWLSNEAPGVLSGVHPPVERPSAAGFLLVRDGRTPLAWADSHGAWLHWMA
jgi:hypothetical protein